MESVVDILNNTRVNSDYHTHVSMIYPNGTYQISRDNIEHFWTKYSDEIYFDENSKQTQKEFGIAEKPQTFLPVLVDIDIKLPFTENMDMSKLYNEFHLESIVRDYQDVLRKIIRMPDGEENLNYFICFVLEKPAYRITVGETEIIKNGFHLHFPYIFLSRNDHEAHLIPRVKALLNKNKLFNHLGIENTGDLVDPSYTRVPWLLYGSKKKEGMDAYRLTKIYDADREKIDLKTALENYKIYDAEENQIDLTGRYEYYLPRILSIIPWHRTISEVKPNLPSLIKINTGNEKKKKDYIAQNLSETLEKANKFISIMSSTRAEIYSDWMQIGWALYNISNGSDTGMKLWLDFSSKCAEKFDEAVCISTWEKMEKRNITLGTIIHFAREDNPVEYNKIVQTYSEEYIKQSLEGSHNDIAKACYEKYGTEFVCASVTKDVWYQFRNHKWWMIDQGVDLRKRLSDDLVKIFQNKQSEIYIKLAKAGESEKPIYTAQLKQVQKMINNLKTAPFKTNVMKECKEVFYNEDFLKNLNKNSFLIGFRNGVYDLKTNNFRPGIPEDYISMQMPIDFSEYKETDQVVKDVYDFFEKIFPDKDVREYFMDISSDVFVGGNRKKHVYFWSGEGDNGKSVTELFFEKMLGEYAVKLPTSLIVGKRTQSSQSSPELVRAGNGVRWAILQEPDKKDVINIGILKELSGNDSFFARGLFQDGGEIEPMFKLSVICNDPPSIPYSDRATWNRIRVIPFESTFCNDPPVTLEEQILQKRFAKDPFFAEKIPNLVKAFAWILLERRKKQNVKLVEPEKVKIATDGYRKKNDSFQQFVDDCIVVDPSGRINFFDLYARFKEWYRDSFPAQTVPIKSEVKEHYVKVWGEPEKGNGGTWRGRRALTVEDEVNNGDLLLIPQPE